MVAFVGDGDNIVVENIVHKVNDEILKLSFEDGVQGEIIFLVESTPTLEKNYEEAIIIKDNT